MTGLEAKYSGVEMIQEVMRRELEREGGSLICLVEASLIVSKPIGGLNGVNVRLPSGSDLCVHPRLQGIAGLLNLQVLGLDLVILDLDGVLLTVQGLQDLLFLVAELLDALQQRLMQFRLLNTLTLQIIQVIR